MAEQVSGLRFQVDAVVTKFLKEINQVNKSLTSLDRTTRNLQNVLSGLGVGFGFYQLGSAVLSAIKTFSDFEYQMSEVKAISGATEEQFKALTDDAIRLGRSTVFTATQVGELQVAFARLGFTTEEILNATEATLDLASATGSDLAESAEVAGSTLRAFGLDAVETQRVTDVMSGALNKSALATDSFRESMKFVAPVARAAGATVEETSALLGVLANNGIKGSIAGTSLRRIFSDLTRDGRPLQERLAELGKQGLTLQQSFDEIGRVAQTALLVLANNTDEIGRLTDELYDVEGATKRIRDIRLDTLQGDVVRLQSAWQGFLISSQQGFGFWRSAVQELTLAFNDLVGEQSAVQTILPTLIGKVSRGLGSDSKIFQNLVDDLREARIQAEAPIDTQYYEKLLNTAELTAEEFALLKSVIEQVNNELSNKEIGRIEFVESFAPDASGISDFLRGLKKTEENYNALAKASEKYLREKNRLAFQVEREIANGQRLSDGAWKIAEGYREQGKAVQEWIDGLLKTFGLNKSNAESVDSVSEAIIRSAEKGVIPLGVSYEQLSKALSEANKNFEAGYNNNLKDLDVKARIIKLIDKEIKRLDDLRRAKKRANGEDLTPPVPEDFISGYVDEWTKEWEKAQDELLTNRNTITTGRSLFSDTENMLFFDGRVLDEGLVLYQAYVDAMIEKGEEYMSHAEWKAKRERELFEQAQERMQIAGETAQFLANITSSSLADMISGQLSFAEGLARATDSIVQEYGRQAIGAMIASSIKDPTVPLPWAKIAQTAILVGVVSGILRKAVGFRSGSKGGGGGVGSSLSRSTSQSSSYSMAQDTAPIIIIPDLVIRGQDMYVQFKQYEENRRRTSSVRYG